MKKIKMIFVLVFVLFASCTQKMRPIKGDTPYQRQQNADFKDASKSPLKPSDLKVFKGLDFFKHDSTYMVHAKLERTPDTKWFKMKTTTDRLSEERVYGVLSFQLKGESFKLKVYQGKELMTQEGFEDYLFLPFLDETNGFESYGGGRYIDVRIPKSDSLIIDFNKAYNPYCAYNEAYSCPIVPRENYLKTRVEAGVKAFKKD
ncbi:DUF1684 domain-containing protein [Tamlana sp. s12]|uniref:DUF1684 domain-containing protein n=1 Tax=Tamlana sp. s12 TaxID=1630406 RepID=UPI0007FDAB05|nr:DUF1684 domain-containing protein [Tamlana sp. s12]OBQ56462.1 hypothetical protein VQ01_03660 [Tamlana sp. s12]QQY81913.1 DUF1684 domain-containing protein [Tamlana sp. s12]